MTDFVLQPGVTRDVMLGRVQGFISSLGVDKAWLVSIKPWKAPRSVNQNRALWWAYGIILKDGGEAMGGWEADDLHEYFLGENFGWEVVELFGKKRQRPMRRSSKLDKSEFAAFFDFIQRKAASFGVYVPDPDPMWNLK